MSHTISKHAAIRMNQRGIRKVDIELLIAHADIAIPCNHRGTSFSMTWKGYRDLIDSGVPVQVADRVKNVCAIVSWDGTIITAMKLSGFRGKRYRRDKQFDRRKASGRTI